MVNDYLVSHLKYQSIKFDRIHANKREITKEDVLDLIKSVMFECDDEEIEWVKKEIVDEF